MHGGHDVDHRCAGVMHQGAAFIHARDRFGDQHFDLAGGRRAALRERPHLAGDHGEAEPGLAGAGGLDGGTDADGGERSGAALRGANEVIQLLVDKGEKDRADRYLYNQPEEPRSTTEGYLGLTRENVQVRYQPAQPARPDDEILSIAIVNYHYRFLSPWLTETFVNPRPVIVTAPMAYQAVSLSR